MNKIEPEDWFPAEDLSSGSRFQNIKNSHEDDEGEEADYSNDLGLV